MLSKKSLITLAAFLSLAVNGLTFTFIGASLPVIQADLTMSIGMAGTLTAFLQVGFTLFSLIAGILSDRIRSERILCVGCLLLGCASLIFGVHNIFAIHLAVVFVMGAGLGCILSGSNTLLVNLYPEKKGTVLNIHHVFFGLGSLLGPLLSSLLLLNGNRWRSGFVVEFFLLIPLGLFFLLAGGNTPGISSGSHFQDQLKKLIRDKHFIIILFVNTLAVGTQVAILLLGVTYLVLAKECSLTVAGTALSLFALCMMVGRVICSRLTLFLPHTTIILSLLWLQSLALLLVSFGSAWLAVASLCLSGMTISGIYPTSLALCGILFPGVRGSALGILTTMGGAGSIFLCWIIGTIAGEFGMAYAFFALLLACILALVVFQFYQRSLCQREASC